VPGSAELALGEMLGVPFLEGGEVLVDGEALVEVDGHLLAFGHLVGALHSVVIEALGQSAFVGQARELVVGLF